LFFNILLLGFQCIGARPPDFEKLMQDGDRFWRMPECYIRGNTIKYLRVPDEVSLFS